MKIKQKINSLKTTVRAIKKGWTHPTKEEIKKIMAGLEKTSAKRKEEFAIKNPKIFMALSRVATKYAMDSIGLIEPKKRKIIFDAVNKTHYHLEGDKNIFTESVAKKSALELVKILGVRTDLFLIKYTKVMTELLEQFIPNAKQKWKALK